MEFDIGTRIGLILAGLLLVVFLNFDITSILSRILFWKNNNSVSTSEKDFLTMVNLWYKLKEMCNKHQFVDASNKLDDVFPLLNDRSKQ